MSATYFLLVVLGLCLLAAPASTTTSGPYKSLGDLFQGQLANLPNAPPGNPALGGQDFLQCCLLAVNESLELNDGELGFRNGQTVLHGNVSTFLSNQFPCTASYNGSEGDQPQVTITYSWCHSNCGGWAMMTTRLESNWIKPLIGYILPTIVFCFSIPRRRAIHIPSSLFPSAKLFVCPENLTLLYKLPAAVFLTILDTLLWVIACIVLSGPMLLSGFLELMLDARLLQFLSSRRNLDVKTRAHLLLIALIGNLDEDPAWEHSKMLVSLLVDDSNLGDTSPNESSAPPAQNGGKSKVEWSSPEQGPTFRANGNFGSNFHGSLQQGFSVQLEIFKLRLISLLEAQSSFATSVGIGVIFYASSFFYGIGDIKRSYGDAGTSHSVAFGCFWMTIGHVAVVARMLLAGDNPSCWEGIAAQIDCRPKKYKEGSRRHSGSTVQLVHGWLQTSIQRRRVQLPSGFKMLIYRSGFASKYKTAWMWNRGSRKAMWIARLAEEYDLPELQREVLYMGWKEWIFATTLPTLLLYLIPTFLGGMTSYTTPIVGLSCRSMVPLMFSSTQTILVFLWLCDWRFWKRNSSMEVLTSQHIMMQRHQRLSGLEMFWYALYILAFVGAIVFSVGGTTFQLMGLFGNCLCYIPIWNWKSRWSPKTSLYLSGNSVEQIFYAKRFWIPIAVSATVFLIFTTYYGWQSQHRIQRQYMQLVEDLDVVFDPVSKEENLGGNTKQSPMAVLTAIPLVATEV